jgi:hypothetical protein
LLSETRLTIYLGRYAVERYLGHRYGSVTAAVAEKRDVDEQEAVV